MNYKASLINLLISMIASPIVFYVVVNLAKLFGASYDITHGESFIIWLLMAILINLSLTEKGS